MRKTGAVVFFMSQPYFVLALAIYQNFFYYYTAGASSYRTKSLAQYYTSLVYDFFLPVE
jgi:hypothetical protein